MFDRIRVRLDAIEALRHWQGEFRVELISNQSLEDMLKVREMMYDRYLIEADTVEISTILAGEWLRRFNGYRPARRFGMSHLAEIRDALFEDWGGMDKVRNQPPDYGAELVEKNFAMLRPALPEEQPLDDHLHRLGLDARDPATGAAFRRAWTAAGDAIYLLDDLR